MADESSVPMIVAMPMVVSMAVPVVVSMRVRVASRANSGVFLKLLHSSSMKAPGVASGRLDAGVRKQFDDGLQILLRTLR